jgi:hypothetical protein
MTLYVNGLQVNDFTFSSGSYTAMHNTAAPVHIGRIASSYANGKIDGVAILNYELSSSQVTTLYGSSSTGIGNPMSLSPKPVAMYNLGDKSAFNNSNYLIPNSSLKDFVFDFDGSNDYIDLGNDVFFNTNNPFSFSTWVNLDSYSDPYPYLVNLKTNVTDGIAIFISNNSSYAGVNVGSTDNSITKGRTTGDISSTFLNSWNHVVVTYNGNGANTLSNYSIYVNGSSVTLTTTGNYSTMPNTANNIGRRSNSYHYLDGKMSNVQIFNTALPATGSNSIETLYNNGSPLTSMSGFTSLVSWWKLNASDTYDSSTGNWTIEDHAGSNDGTSSGMTQANLVQSDLSFTSGYSPYALSFDSASSDYIDCGDSDYFSFGNGSTDSPFSVSAWVNFSDVTNSSLFSKSDASGEKEYSVHINSEKIYFGLYSDLGNDYIFKNYDTALTSLQGSWLHFVFTYDGSRSVNGLKIYLNNSRVDDQSFTSGTYVAMNNGTAPFKIGRSFNNRYLNGSISNVSIWNAALTSTQVSEIYSEGIPQNLSNHSAVSSLVSWWQLGSNSSFNSSLNQWTCIDEKGTNTGESSQTFNEDAIVDGVGSYANGVGTSGLEVIGSAPFSDANSLSINMDVLDRVEDTPA